MDFGHSIRRFEHSIQTKILQADTLHYTAGFSPSKCYALKALARCWFLLFQSVSWDPEIHKFDMVNLGGSSASLFAENWLWRPLKWWLDMAGPSEHSHSPCGDWEICRHATASAMNLLSGKWELDVTRKVTTKGGHTNPVQYDWSIWRGLIFNWNSIYIYNSFIFLATWWSDGRLRRRILALLLS